MTGTLPGSQTPGANPSTHLPADLRHAAKAVTNHPNRSSAWSHLGSVLLLHHQYAQATLAFKRAIKLDPHSVAARFDLAFLDIGRRKHAAALQVLAPMITSENTSPRLWLLEGLARSQTAGGRPQALRDWRRFLSLSPTGTIAQEVRGWIADLEHGKPVP